jgi:hypothetical protein
MRGVYMWPNCQSINSCRKFVDDTAAPLPEDALSQLGVQASQRIVAASDPLRVLAAITGNFPSLAAAVSKDEVDAGFEEAFAAQQQRLPPGSHLLVNGIHVRLLQMCLSMRVGKSSAPESARQCASQTQQASELACICKRFYVQRCCSDGEGLQA